MADNQSQDERFEELCAGYVLHALEQDERDEFEQMLSEASEEQRSLFQQMWSTANQLAFTVKKNEPSTDLKDRLMAEVRGQSKNDADKSKESHITSIDEGDEQDQSESTSKKGSGLNWPALTAAASFALLIVCLSLIFYSFNLSSEINKKESVIAQKQTEISELKTELQQKQEMLSILEAREVDFVSMSGMEVNPEGYGKIIWDSEKQQALLQVSNLPAVPEDKDYQLWLIKNNTPVSAGVFAVNNKEDKFFKIKQMAQVGEDSASAFAVTMEPKGGMPQPTGDMYLMGNMNNNE